jgi:hypothetical protein
MFRTDNLFMARNKTIDRWSIELDVIQTGFSSEWRRLSSFRDIFEILKQHNFEIVPGVDSEEVSTFVEWVELLEQSR